jgi:hypothetical protein
MSAQILPFKRPTPGPRSDLLLAETPSLLRRRATSDDLEGFRGIAHCVVASVLAFGLAWLVLR